MDGPNDAIRKARLDLITWLEQQVGSSDDGPDVGTIAQRLSNLPGMVRRRLAEDIGSQLGKPGVLRVEGRRAFLVRALVALLPEALDVIRSLLRKTATNGVAELHFSLFVFLGDSLSFRTSPQFSSEVLTEVEGYLGRIDSQTGQAAWMAGDLLGDHWPLKEALPVLRGLATDARYVAGREGALHGLAHALDRADKAQQWEIVATLRLVAQKDRSAKVRRYASSIIGELRGL